MFKSGNQGDLILTVDDGNTVAAEVSDSNKTDEHQISENSSNDSSLSGTEIEGDTTDIEFGTDSSADDANNADVDALYDSDSASGSSDDMADEGNIFTQSKYLNDIVEN